MNIFEKVETLRIVLLATAGVAFMLLLVFLIFMMIRNKKKKKLMVYFNQKLHETLRNDMLERAINNYSKPLNKNYWLVKVVEKNQFGEKDHFFNLSSNDIAIGRDFNLSDLCLFDEKVDKTHCRVELHKEIPNLVNISKKSDTYFYPNKKRGRKIEKKHKMRTGESLRLSTYDCVEMGNSKLVFYIYSNIDGIV